MYEHDLRRLRSTLDEGEPIDDVDVRALIDEVDALRRRIGTPTELHLTARVDPDHPDHWSIDHPLLMSRVSAASLPDALTLAAVDLRRALGDDDAPDPRRRRVDRAEWSVLARGGSTTAEALAGAIAALERAEDDRDEMRAELDDHRVLRSVRVGGSPREVDEARRRSRARSLERLAAAGVQGVERQWAADGFGSADDHGVPLPVLAVAVRVRGDARDLRWRFAGDRRWLALEHRVSDGMSSDHLTMVATILAPSREAEGLLRRLPLLVPGRNDTVAHHCRYAEVLAELFGAGSVTADRERGRIGGGCWPLDPSSLAALTSGEITAQSLDGWATPGSERSWLEFGPAWELWWLATTPERDW